MVPSAHQGTPKQRHFNSISPEAGDGVTLFALRGACPPNIQIFSIDHLDLSTRHGSTAWQWDESAAAPSASSLPVICHSVRFQFVNSGAHPKFTFHYLPFLSTFIMPFIAPGTFAFLSKKYGEFSTGHFDPIKAYDPNSLAELSQWRKEFLDGRYGSKQPTPPFTPRAPSPSFPIPVIVGRQMYPGDDGHESEDDEILLPPPPIPPQIDPPPPNVPIFDYHPQNVQAVRVQPMQQGHEPLPLRDMPQFAHPPPNVPEIGMGPIHDEQQPMPLRVLAQIAHRQLNFPVIRVQPVQQPIPLRDVPLFVNPPPNVPIPNAFSGKIHVRQIQRDYAVPQFAQPPPNMPLIFYYPPTIQPRQQRLPLRDGPQFDHPRPNGPAFRYLLETEKKQRQMILELMEKAGISMGDKTFGIQHLEAVQKFWDKEFPDTFRIVAFEMKFGLKPIFKGEGAHKHEIEVIREGSHWDEIKSASWFFGVRYFCVGCEVTYDRPERHRMECKERCKKCCRMGFGFPCADVCVKIHCEECNLNFYNNECFEAHKKAACNEYKKCEKCGEVYQTRSKHVCGDLDVIKDSVTIAGVVMKIFRAKFLKDRHIPIMPEGGYERAENQSKIAVKYFEWLAQKKGVKVRHACNGGEVEFGGLKVDCVIGAEKKIIEFQGCAFHGCPRCFLPWTIAPNGRTMEENRSRTEIRMEILREKCQNFSIGGAWECDVQEELKKNKEIKKFFESVTDKGPINPRDAYAGGRTMPFCLYAKATEEIEISMFDIISLYPFVNYDTPYPFGVPKIVVSRNFNVKWTVPDDVPYDGLLKVKVIPPKNLLYPLLPMHIDDMLLFPNCWACAKRAKNEFVMAKDVKKCNHRPAQRAFLGTFTSIELRKTLELGYRVIGFYRAYHFEQFDSQLFKGYVRMFLKIKVEASGWPAEVKSEEEKRAFLEMYKAYYDINLEYDKIGPIPG
ncbi:hypothetical protein niasHT_014728 [Heterodera trifolii]|uniref:DNA-directed DNA polymerase n=1 Tax=Heterodera trifolii TaxID=157864 RepID=A0ABD2KYK5_9BILA